MSALEDYADIIAVVRKTDLPDEAETFSDGMRHAIKAMAAELEQRDNDAALGRSVREMPFGWRLYHSMYPHPDGAWYVFDMPPATGPGQQWIADTPEAALEEALDDVPQSDDNDV